MKQVFFSTLVLSVFLISSCKTVTIPAEVQNVLSKNYPDYKVESAEMAQLCTGESFYEIELEGANDKRFEVAINNEGIELFSSHEITVADLPTDATNNIKSNFPGYSIKEAERIDLPNSHYRYDVKMKNGKTIFVLVDEIGAAICERKKR